MLRKNDKEGEVDIRGLCVVREGLTEETLSGDQESEGTSLMDI